MRGGPSEVARYATILPGSGATIILNRTLPPITETSGLTIFGGKTAKIVVSGNDKVRVFALRRGAKLDLKNVTVYNGPANGNNLGGVKNNGGTLKVFRSTFVGNNALAVGGGIANISDGTLTVKNSTFSGNKAGSAGGGILNDGTLKVTYVTFSGNDAELIGGGIQNANDKGATVRLDKAVLANSPNGNINNVCAAGQCRGKIIDGGYNISDDASFRFTTPISKSRTNPKLDTDGLKYNGGPHRDHSPANDLPRRQLHSQRHERLRNHHEDRSARGTQAPRQEVRRGSLRADAAALERLAKGLTFCEPRFQLSAVSRQLLADR